MAEVTLDKTPKKVRDLFNKGFSAFERGTLDYAIDLFLTCLELEPALLQARKFLRAAEIQKFKKKKSNILTHAISSTVGLPGYTHTMALIQTGKFNQAVILSEKLLKRDPLNIKFINLFVQASTKADLPEAAILTLEVARDYYPDNIRVINWLANLYQKVGRMRSARKCFEVLCDIAPNDPKALKSLKDAMALDSMATDGWSEASEKGQTYREMIKNSKEAELLEQNAKAVKSDKDVNALIEDTLAKIEATPENINYYRSLARLYAQGNNFNDAIAVLNKALEINPNDPELHNMLSSTYIKYFDASISELKTAGNNEEAESLAIEKKQYLMEDLSNRVKRYPNDLKLRHDLGIMLFNAGQLNDAIQQFQLSQRSPKDRIKSLYYLALCFKHKKQYDMASEQLKIAVNDTPAMDETKKDIIYELGEISMAVGNKEEAIEYYKQIYQVDISYKDIANKIEQAYE